MIQFLLNNHHGCCREALLAAGSRPVPLVAAIWSQCIAWARAMLQNGASAPHTEDFSLGARLGQCCGGKTTLLFEPLLQA